MGKFFNKITNKQDTPVQPPMGGALMQEPAALSQGVESMNQEVMQTPMAPVQQPPTEVATTTLDKKEIEEAPTVQDILESHELRLRRLEHNLRLDF